MLCVTCSLLCLFLVVHTSLDSNRLRINNHNSQLSLSLSLCLSIYLPVLLRTYPSICPSVYPSVYLSIHLSTYLPVCLYAYLSMYLCISLSVYLSEMFCIYIVIIQRYYKYIYIKYINIYSPDKHFTCSVGSIVRQTIVRRSSDRRNSASTVCPVEPGLRHRVRPGRSGESRVRRLLRGVQNQFSQRIFRISSHAIHLSCS